MSLLGSQQLKYPSSKYIPIFLQHCLEIVLTLLLLLKKYNVAFKMNC